VKDADALSSASKETILGNPISKHSSPNKRQMQIEKTIAVERS
jgi:hypothetical protein